MPKRIHYKSLRKVTQGLRQRIPDKETTIVQLAEGASWTGCTDQLVRSGSWISQTRRTGKLDRASRPTRLFSELDRTCSPSRPFGELDQSACICPVLVTPPPPLGLDQTCSCFISIGVTVGTLWFKNRKNSFSRINIWIDRIKRQRLAEHLEMPTLYEKFECSSESVLFQKSSFL